MARRPSVTLLDDVLAIMTAKSGTKLGPGVKTASLHPTFLGVVARHPQSRCISVPVNDIDGCYRYLEVARLRD